MANFSQSLIGFQGSAAFQQIAIAGLVGFDCLPDPSATTSPIYFDFGCLYVSRLWSIDRHISCQLPAG